MSRKRIKHNTSYRFKRETVEKFGPAVLGSGCLLYVVWTLLAALFHRSKDPQVRLRTLQSHPDLHVAGPNSENYNALASDIMETLKCLELLNQTQADMLGVEPLWKQPIQRGEEDEEDKAQKPPSRMHDPVDMAPLQPGQNVEAQHMRRRLAEEDMSEDFGLADDAGIYNSADVNPSAAHLFCLAAISIQADYWKPKLSCDPSKHQLALLELWGQARSEMTEEILVSTVKLAIENERKLLEKSLHIWAPPNDDGLTFVVETLNKDFDADHGGIRGLERNLGPNKLWVDVGSCIGLSSMGVSILYPNTDMISIEAAPPNWLLQQMNWICHDTLTKPKHVILSGVGPSDHATQAAKVIWKPTSTTSARSWTPKSERLVGDVELMIKLRPWHSLLAEAEILQRTVDVLNVDCQGCEYNLIPSLKDEEFAAMSTVMGGVHWGYIPTMKLPSSKRAAETHRKLCQHENFARNSKECCDFADLHVQSSVPGEVLVQDSQKFPPPAVTVRDVAGSLCDDFVSWAEMKHLHDIESDWGWFQLTSMAD